MLKVLVSICVSVTVILFLIGIQHCCHIHPLLSCISYFLQYQLMAKADIPEHVWESALVVDGETRHHRMDLIWSHLKAMKYPDGALMFEQLAVVALLVLTLPHSNAEEE